MAPFIDEMTRMGYPWMLMSDVRSLDVLARILKSDGALGMAPNEDGLLRNPTRFSSLEWLPEMDKFEP